MSDTADMMVPRRKTLFLAILLAALVIGIAALSKYFGLSEGVSILLFFASLLLVFPLMRSAERAEVACGAVTSAGRRYGRRMMVASVLYAITLMGAIWLSKIGTYPTPVYVLLAVAPSFPVVAMIWAMGRLLVEETDEYIRSRHVHHALVATGITLTLASVWGFLEQFNLVPHLAAYWVFPAWALALGISQFWSAVRS